MFHLLAYLSVPYDLFKDYINFGNVYRYQVHLENLIERSLLLQDIFYILKELNKNQEKST